MKPKKPDIDTRGYPRRKESGVTKTEGSLKNLPRTKIMLDVPHEINEGIRAWCADRRIDFTAFQRSLYLQAAKAIGLNTDYYEDLNKSMLAEAPKQYRLLHMSLIALDECDFPGVAASAEIGSLHPYQTTFPEAERRETMVSPRLAELNAEIDRAAKSVAKLSEMKKYQGFFTEGSISLEEAKAQLDELLGVLPSEVKEELWDWCSINDAIYMVKKYARGLKAAAELQILLEEKREQRELRARISQQQADEIQKQRDVVLGRTRHWIDTREDRLNDNWLSWAGSMEDSYLDYCANRQTDSNLDQRPQNKRARIPQADNGEIIVHEIIGHATKEFDDETN